MYGLCTMTALLALPILLACTVTDGDTIRCGDERIRLTGIDAPEMRGHCAAWRKCVAGDARASSASLAEAMRQGPIRIDRRGTDRYGRTLAIVYAGPVNLACWQLAHGSAVYVGKWDAGGDVARACGTR